MILSKKTKHKIVVNTDKDFKKMFRYRLFSKRILKQRDRSL